MINDASVSGNRRCYRLGLFLRERFWFRQQNVVMDCYPRFSKGQPAPDIAPGDTAAGRGLTGQSSNGELGCGLLLVCGAIGTSLALDAFYFDGRGANTTPTSMSREDPPGRSWPSDASEKCPCPVARRTLSCARCSSARAAGGARPVSRTRISDRGQSPSRPLNRDKSPASMRRRRGEKRKAAGTGRTGEPQGQKRR